MAGKQGQARPGGYRSPRTAALAQARWETRYRPLVDGVTCPACGVTEGRCVDLRPRINGTPNTTPTARPHAARLVAGRTRREGPK